MESQYQVHTIHGNKNQVPPPKSMKNDDEDWDWKFGRDGNGFVDGFTHSLSLSEDPIYSQADSKLKWQGVDEYSSSSGTTELDQCSRINHSHDSWKINEWMNDCH